MEILFNILVNARFLLTAQQYVSSDCVTRRGKKDIGRQMDSVLGYFCFLHVHVIKSTTLTKLHIQPSLQVLPVSITSNKTLIKRPLPGNQSTFKRVGHYKILSAT